MLKVEGLSVQYGAIRALRDASFEVAEGEIITLIGSNGAGKSTTLSALSNVVRKSAGTVTFRGQDITSAPPEEIVRLGLVQVPEGRRGLREPHRPREPRHGRLYPARQGRDRRGHGSRLRAFPRIRARSPARGHPLGGEQQMLAIGRALMAAPRLLLLDEPSMGLAPILVDEIFHIVKTINQGGTTVLLVEQNAYKALRLANRAYILETGEIVRTGTGPELLGDDAVRAAYLGG
jgi:branched-chain amino acid transport system ATP-binding protein